MNLASELDASPSTSTVSITVLSVTPAHARKLFAFASVELDIDGVQIEVHGIRAMREPEGTAIELPKFRDAGGVWRTAITLRTKFARRSPERCSTSSSSEAWPRDARSDDCRLRCPR
jgi:hypothetical protein